MNSVRYVPGPWAVIVTPAGIAVLGANLPDGRPDGDMPGGDVPGADMRGTKKLGADMRGTERPGADMRAGVLAGVWQGLSGGGGLGSVLESLTGAFGTSLAAIPPFAVALVEGDAVRVVVRGEIAVQVTADADETVSGAGVTTWSERVIAGARVLDFVLPSPSSPVGAVVPDGQDAADAAGPRAWFPLTGGIVLASALRVELAPAPIGSVIPASTPDLPASTPAAPSATPSHRASGGDQASGGDLPGIHPPEAGSPPQVASALPGLIDSAAVLAATDGDTWMPVDSTLASETAGEYDDLWGATIARPLEDAAVRPDEPEPDDEAEPAPAGAPAPAPVPAPTPAPTPVRPVLDTEGDHDGATISVAQARALRDAAHAAHPEHGAAASTHSTPDMSAPAASAPAANTPISVPPVPPASAAVGTIRLSTGQAVGLDRTVIIGRRPRSTRVSGTELPHLIAVDSPEQDISRSHVEIRPEHDSVVVIDLHTTNGTTLLREGSEPMRLHPGEHTVVVSGDVIDLGDGITVAFEDLP